MKILQYLFIQYSVLNEKWIIEYTHVSRKQSVVSTNKMINSRLVSNYYI